MFWWVVIFYLEGIQENHKHPHKSNLTIEHQHLLVTSLQAKLKIQKVHILHWNIKVWWKVTVWVDANCMVYKIGTDCNDWQPNSHSLKISSIQSPRDSSSHGIFRFNQLRHFVLHLTCFTISSLGFLWFGNSLLVSTTYWTIRETKARKILLKNK